eukprot:GHVR01158916.1.p2 GENE.GHVR01158916.1~~GHVR01158916.1.p2  ORF type:complete len:202 (-),score=36.97 GHVR01158916.1:42-647(-)
MGIALTKCMAEGDLELLPDELYAVDRVFDSSQSRYRRWEYAMALRAYLDSGAALAGGYIIDVGGTGSPFQKMVEGEVDVIDPRENIPVEEWFGQPASAVFCISVIEHVENLEDFCSHLIRVTSPGGLLFLTMDIWDGGDEDKAHFSWLRKRIFTPASWMSLSDWFLARGFSLLGEADWAYHGCELENWGYSFASLALVKEK